MNSNFTPNEHKGSGEGFLGDIDPTDDTRILQGSSLPSNGIKHSRHLEEEEEEGEDQFFKKHPLLSPTKRRKNFQKLTPLTRQSSVKTVPDQQKKGIPNDSNVEDSHLQNHSSNFYHVMVGSQRSAPLLVSASPSHENSIHVQESNNKAELLEQALTIPTTPRDMLSSLKISSRNAKAKKVRFSADSLPKDWNSRQLHELQSSSLDGHGQKFDTLQKNLLEDIPSEASGALHVHGKANEFHKRPKSSCNVSGGISVSTVRKRASTSSLSSASKKTNGHHRKKISPNKRTSKDAYNSEFPKKSMEDTGHDVKLDEVGDKVMLHDSDFNLCNIKYAEGDNSDKQLSSENNECGSNYPLSLEAYTISRPVSCGFRARGVLNLKHGRIHASPSKEKIRNAQKRPKSCCEFNDMEITNCSFMRGRTFRGSNTKNYGPRSTSAQGGMFEVRDESNSNISTSRSIFGPWTRRAQTPPATYKKNSESPPFSGAVEKNILAASCHEDKVQSSSDSMQSMRISSPVVKVSPKSKASTRSALFKSHINHKNIIHQNYKKAKVSPMDDREPTISTISSGFFDDVPAVNLLGIPFMINSNGNSRKQFFVCKNKNPLKVQNVLRGRGYHQIGSTHASGQKEKLEVDKNNKIESKREDNSLEDDPDDFIPSSWKQHEALEYFK